MLCSSYLSVTLRADKVYRLPCFTVGAPSRRVVRHQAVVTQAVQKPEHDTTCLDRRAALLTGLLAAALGNSTAAYADGEISTFYGLATPPTSYGGYGGNANEKPKYAFEYPTGWKSDVINKVEKGTQGIDGRVYNPRNRNEQVFVITLSRLGEDANFALRDIDSTFAGFAGADYDLQDALTVSTNKTSSTREKNGQLFYDVQVDSPDVTYLSTITVAQGKVYAMFTKVPTKAFRANEDKYKGIVQSFRLL